MSTDRREHKRMTLDEHTEHTDMVVKIDDVNIKCSKAIVCRYSNVINAAMASDMIEGTSGVFTITHELATEDNVRPFLMCMYDPWDASMMDAHAFDIYRLAHVYDSARVLDMAGAALKRLMTRGTFWQTVAFADECGPGYLMDECIRYAAEQAQLHRLLDAEGLAATMASNPVGVARVQSAIIRAMAKDAYRFENMACSCNAGVACPAVTGLRAGEAITHVCPRVGEALLGTIKKM